MKSAFQLAYQHSGQAGASNKRRYDAKANTASIGVGDRVLVRNMSERGGAWKLRCWWEQKIYVVVSVRDLVPVYTIRPIDSRKTKTVHRNMLLCVNDMPLDTFNQVPVKQTTPVVRRRAVVGPRQKEKRKPAGNTTVPVTLDSSDSSSDAVFLLKRTPVAANPVDESFPDDDSNSSDTDVPPDEGVMEFDAIEWSTDSEVCIPLAHATSSSSGGVPIDNVTQDDPAAESCGREDQHAPHNLSHSIHSDTESPVVDKVHGDPDSGMPPLESDTEHNQVLLDPTAAEFIPRNLDSPIVDIDSPQKDKSPSWFDDSISSQDVTFRGFPVSSDEEVSAPTDDTVVDVNMGGSSIESNDDGLSTDAKVVDTLVAPSEGRVTDCFQTERDADEHMAIRDNAGVYKSSTDVLQSEYEANGQLGLQMDNDVAHSSSEEFHTDAGSSHLSDYTTADESPPPVRPLFSTGRSRPSASGRTSRDSQPGNSRRSVRRRRAKEFLTYNRDFKQTVGTHGPGYIMCMQVEEQ